MKKRTIWIEWVRPIDKNGIPCGDWDIINVLEDYMHKGKDNKYHQYRYTNVTATPPKE